eukprot:COSAG01_NODE_25383_length_747_cov_0.631173_1_plen_126_part_01
MRRFLAEAPEASLGEWAAQSEWVRGTGGEVDEETGAPTRALSGVWRQLWEQAMATEREARSWHPRDTGLTAHTGEIPATSTVVAAVMGRQSSVEAGRREQARRLSAERSLAAVRQEHAVAEAELAK